MQKDALYQEKRLNFQALRVLCMRYMSGLNYLVAFSGLGSMTSTLSEWLYGIYELRLCGLALVGRWLSRDRIPQFRLYCRVLS